MKKRREFIQTMLGLTVGMMLPYPSLGNNLLANDKWGEILPKRKLGITGENVTMLGLVVTMLVGRQRAMHRR